MDELQAERGAAGGRVSAGRLSLMPKFVLARTVGRLLEAYPNVQVKIEEASHEALMEGLRSSELDVVVGALRHRGDSPPYPAPTSPWSPSFGQAVRSYSRSPQIDGQPHAVTDHFQCRRKPVPEDRTNALCP
jgi:DNA-binding transcriptional LysR family regulator